MPKPEPPSIKAPAGPILIDQKAQQEQQLFVAGRKRSNREEDAKHYLFIFLLWIGGLIYAVVFIIIAYHYLCPPEWTWLSEARLDSLNRFITSSFLGAAVGRLFRSKIGLPEKADKGED